MPYIPRPRTIAYCIVPKNAGAEGIIDPNEIDTITNTLAKNGTGRSKAKMLK